VARNTRWGILGTGKISSKFAEALAVLHDAELVAVGSRSKESAAAFATKYKVPRVHSSYEDLARDDGVEAVYIGTPHPYHCANTLLCLEAGKSVLVEKPFAMNEREARLMVDTARRTKRFLMEAMWTHFLPATVRCFELAAKGAIGDPFLLHADFGFTATFDPKSRLFNPALGGGSLLDVGVYPVSLATRLFGEPSKIQSSAVLGKTGVDEVATMILEYEGGKRALLSSTIRSETGQGAVLSGTAGRIRIEPQFWHSQKLTVSGGSKEETLDLPYEGNGFPHQAREVMRCLAEGALESPRMSHDFSLQVMRTLDRIRAPWGLRYPGE
jgi:predicted dehydrogenase